MEWMATRSIPTYLRTFHFTCRFENEEVEGIVGRLENRGRVVPLKFGTGFLIGKVRRCLV